MSQENPTPEEVKEQEAKDLETAKAQAEAEAKEKAETEKHEKLKSLSDDEKMKEILALRNEAKERRLKEKELSEKLSEFEKKQSEEIEKDKKAKGKHEEIIADLKKELESLKPLAEKYSEYNTAKRLKIKTTLEESGDWMDSFEKLELSELEELAEKFTGSKKTPTDTTKNFHNKNGKDERSTEEKLESVYKD